MKFWNLASAATALVLSGNVNAATIALDDWWLQTDNLGGLRQSSINENIYYAVSKTTTYNSADVYELPTGFHWASWAEYESGVAGQGTGTYVYYNQGGWSGYNWEGDNRYHFLLNENGTAAQSKVHVGNFEYYIGKQYTGWNNIAGFVLVKDAVVPAASVVPVPAAVWLFGSGLLGLIGLARRKKA